MDKPENILQSLESWEHDLAVYFLPSWDDLPTIDLYMDQVVVLMGQYLTIASAANDKSLPVITPSTINNYVRLKLLPPPHKKKYSRLHLAYLLMICTLKPTLSISDLQKLLPANLSEEEMQSIYSNFVATHAKTSLYFLEQVKNLEPKAAEQSVRNFICEGAIISGLIQSLNEKLLATPESE